MKSFATWRPKLSQVTDEVERQVGLRAWAQREVDAAQDAVRDKWNREVQKAEADLRRVEDGRDQALGGTLQLAAAGAAPAALGQHPPPRCRK